MPSPGEVREFCDRCKKPHRTTHVPRTCPDCCKLGPRKTSKIEVTDIDKAVWLKDQEAGWPVAPMWDEEEDDV